MKSESPASSSPTDMNFNDTKEQKEMTVPPTSNESGVKLINSNMILQRMGTLYFNSQITKKELIDFIDVKFLKSYSKFVNQQLCQSHNSKSKKLIETENSEEIQNSTSKHVKFSAKEDELLKKVVEKFGPKNWRLIASMIPGRSQRQCRDRYMNYLSPSFSRSQWTDEEDNLLAEKYILYGPKWTQIRQFFPYRTANDIKNHFNYTVSKKMNLIKIPENYCENNNTNNKSGFANENTTSMPFDVFVNADLIELNQEPIFFGNDELQLNEFL